MKRLPIVADPRTPRRTKIVATLGPASRDPQRIRELLLAGVNVCRLNFSHGTHADHAATLRTVRDISKQLNLPVGVLGDLCGPKIRLNEVPPNVTLSVGQPVRFVRGAGPCTADTLTINYPKFVDEVTVGNRIYIDDGLVRLLVVERDADSVSCVCTVGGVISSRKGVNLPDTRLSISALTAKDRADVEWAIEHGLDFLALSFAREPNDLKMLKDLLASHRAQIPVIIKIEKAEAIPHLDYFIAAADGIMVARGDLGVELDVWQVPLIQKAILRKCRAAGKPAIVATQMLQSMVSNPMPTRAEVSDVANAIFDATDAIMLSAESASGEFPIESVEMMDRIARATEAYLETAPPEPVDTHLDAGMPAASAIVRGAVSAAQMLNARLVAVWSTSGRTARMIAQHRLTMPVVGLTRDDAVCRRLALVHGVIPVRVDPMSNPTLLASQLDDVLLNRNLAQPGDLVVIVTSTRATVVGATDTTLVHRVSVPAP
jgi:pyruvate kinase